MRLWAVLLAVSSCASPSTARLAAPASPSPARYAASGVVLQRGTQPPVLCVGAIWDSLPPGCDGPRVTPWDWSAVTGETSAAGTTWGSYSLVGTFDGTTFGLTEPAGPAPSVSRSPDPPLVTPCATPAGGWTGDADRGSEAAWASFVTWVRAEPDFAGLWITWPSGPPQDDFSARPPGKVSVLNIAFTGSLDRHRAEIAGRWDGPLCVTGAAHAYAALHDAQEDLTAHRDEARAAGIEVIGASVDEPRDVLEAHAYVADEARQRWLDERYGQGVVELTGEFRPV